MPHDPRSEGAVAARRGPLSSLRVRLMLLAAVAVLPLLVSRVLDIESDRAERMDAAAQQALVLAKQGMTAQNEAVVAARAFFGAVASAQELLTTRGDRCDTLLANVVSQAPWLKSISVATPDG